MLSTLVQNVIKAWNFA